MKKIILAAVLSVFAMSANAAPDYLDYKMVSCISLSEIANAVMSDWQAGTDKGDMLMNSMKYADILAAQNSITKKEAAGFTFPMYMLATREPVHLTAQYKYLAASEFAADFKVTCDSHQ